MTKWLEFKVEEPCKHGQDTYDGCPLCRIAELKAEAIETAAKAQDNLAELEAKLDVFDEMDEMLRICLNANVDMAEKLDRVRGLPEKWREISYKTTEEYTNLHGCADELQAALGDEDE